MDEKFAVNLLRMIAASVYYKSAISTSKEMFGRSYFSLGPVEKAAVDQTVFAGVGSNYQALTPEFLEGQQGRQPMGFPIQAPTPTPGNQQP
jgi:hypothetical protein